MKIYGPLHKFLYLPEGNSGHDYMELMKDPKGAELSDDVLMEILPLVVGMDTYNPSTKTPFKGLNTNGPTVIDGKGVEILVAALDEYLRQTTRGPNQFELGGEIVEKQIVCDHLQKVRDYFADAVANDSKILHLGV